MPSQLVVRDERKSSKHPIISVGGVAVDFGRIVEVEAKWAELRRAIAMRDERRRRRPVARRSLGYARRVLLRCTTRLLNLLGKPELNLVNDPPGNDDWYANLLWIERRKCLLLTHAGTLFPVLISDVRKPDLQPLGPFLVPRIDAALADEKLPADILGPLEADQLRLAQTASRSILGFMNDSASTVRYAASASGGLEHIDLDDLNRRLRRQLHNRDGYRQPLDLVMDRIVLGG